MDAGLQAISGLSLTRGLGTAALDPAGSADGPATTGAGAAAAAGESFSATMSDMAANAVGDLRSAEKLSIEGIKGNADTREVVDAVMNAQQTLQTAIAIRDKIVSAYLEVSHMTI